MPSQEMDISRFCFTFHRSMTFPKANTKYDVLTKGEVLESVKCKKHVYFFPWESQEGWDPLLTSVFARYFLED